MVSASTITPVKGRLKRREREGGYNPADLDNIQIRITRGLQDDENAEFGDYPNQSSLPGLKTGNGIWADYKDTVSGRPGAATAMIETLVVQVLEIFRYTLQEVCTLKEIQ